MRLLSCLFHFWAVFICVCSCYFVQYTFDYYLHNTLPPVICRVLKLTQRTFPVYHIIILICCSFLRGWAYSRVQLQAVVCFLSFTVILFKKFLNILQFFKVNRIYAFVSSGARLTCTSSHFCHTYCSSFEALHWSLNLIFSRRTTCKGKTEDTIYVTCFSVPVSSHTPDSHLASIAAVAQFHVKPFNNYEWSFHPGPSVKFVVW
jgi:hypothetical protein